VTKAAPRPEAVDPPWKQLVLICRKCSRKLDGGFGESGEESLRAEVKRALRTAGPRRRFRVVEVSCLSICPKNAVSVIGPSRPGKVLVVPAGSDPAAVVAMITGPERPHESVR
jgi:predicted metal-binding protein